MNWVVREISEGLDWVLCLRDEIKQKRSAWVYYLVRLASS